MTVKKNTGPINCFKLSLLLKRIVIRFGNMDTILVKISSDQHKLMINVLRYVRILRIWLVEKLQIHINLFCLPNILLVIV
jgi:hypothetical protein